MAWTIIVASSQADQLQELMNGAHAVAAHISPPEDRPKPVMALSVEDVRRKRSRNPATELLIVAASLPNRESSPDAQARPGLNLVQSFAQDAEPPACILVSESDRIEHYRMEGLKRCEWLTVNSTSNYVEQCVELARRLGVIPPDPAAPAQKPKPPAYAGGDGVLGLPIVAAPPTAAGSLPVNGLAHNRGSRLAPSRPQPFRARRRAPAAEPFAVIEVNLPSPAEYATVSVDRHPDVPFRTSSKPLALNPEHVRELVARSKSLRDPRKHDQWQAEYRALGRQIHEMLRDTLFGKYYERASGAVGKNVRVRFNLDQEFFDGLWESMYEPEEPDKFLMLKNTITRRALQDDTFREPEDSEDTLNVLVIKSDVPEGSTPMGPPDPFWQQYWESIDEPLRRLPHLDEEVAVLSALAEPNDDAPAHIRVDVLPDPKLAHRGWSLAKEVEHVLTHGECQYDVVHFAGHALFAPSTEREDGRGYLIFSGPDAPEAVPIGTVAEWLSRRVQLVYLSCCQSSASSAALEFARINVPMTIGFNWNLDDQKAVDFASIFYRELVDNHFQVCQAFNKARLRLFNRHRGGDSIWASPVLIAQPMDWIQVEGVLRPVGRERRLPPRGPSSAPRRRSSVSSTAHAPTAVHA
jgi:CHAT domain